jgi:hypothetical protein
MTKRRFCIWFVVIATGLVVVGCRDNPKQEGVLGEGGVHDPDGVLDEDGPGPGAQTGINSEDIVQINRSGELVARTFSLKDFDKIEASMFDVDIQQGDSFAVAISVERNALAYVRVSVENKWLKIGLDPSHSYNMADIVLQAQVTMPNLTDIDLSLSSESTVSGFENVADVSISLDLASTLTGNWVTGDCDISLALGSRLALTGAGKDMTLTASGSSKAELAEFQVENVTAHAEGNSMVTVNANGDLDKTADSSSIVTSD